MAFAQTKVHVGPVPCLTFRSRHVRQLPGGCSIPQRILGTLPRLCGTLAIMNPHADPHITIAECRRIVATPAPDRGEPRWHVQSVDAFNKAFATWQRANTSCSSFRPRVWVELDAGTPQEKWDPRTCWCLLRDSPQRRPSRETFFL
jgi:hypothetical protein